MWGIFAFFHWSLVLFFTFYPMAFDKVNQKIVITSDFLFLEFRGNITTTPMEAEALPIVTAEATSAVSVSSHQAIISMTRI